MEKYHEKASTSKQKEALCQRCKRQYEDCIQFGFIASGAWGSPTTFLHYLQYSLTNKLLVPSKLSTHLKTNHPTLRGKRKKL